MHSFLFRMRCYLTAVKLHTYTILIKPSALSPRALLCIARDGLCPVYGAYCCRPVIIDNGLAGHLLYQKLCMGHMQHLPAVRSNITYR